jgi:dihydroorotase
MSSILIKNATIVNENKKFVGDVFIEGEIIVEIKEGSVNRLADKIIDANNKLLLPGLIDDQVHFREPGLTHKGNIASESRAAVAGGITSYMEMPNTNPTATTVSELAKKYEIAKRTSWANYSFFMGTTNDNLSEIKKVDFKTVCGLKIFMGSSTGDMLVDNENTLKKIFSEVDVLIATHCEDDHLIAKNAAAIKAKYNDSDIDASFHPIIRNAEACYASSSMAVQLAKDTGARLHVLHISTEKEISLFSNAKLSKDKRITAEACVHHLWFDEEDYKTKGNLIKWNPAIKSRQDKLAIRQALINNQIDVLATDHAPHTIEEKTKHYWQAPSGGPLVQHSLLALLDLYQKGVFSLEMIVEKGCHHPAILFDIQKRGFIREGYYADLVLVDLDKPTNVTTASLLYHCGWSPFAGHRFSSSVDTTIVNGNILYEKGLFNAFVSGQRLTFNRG